MLLAGIPFATMASMVIDVQCDKHMVIYAWKLDTNGMHFFGVFICFYFFSPKNGKQWSLVVQRLV